MRDIKKGTYNGEFTYCPINGYDCPYCDKNCVCHIDDPCKDCDDFNFFFPTWADWEGAEEADGTYRQLVAANRTQRCPGCHG